MKITDKQLRHVAGLRGKAEPVYAELLAARTEIRRYRKLLTYIAEGNPGTLLSMNAYKALRRRAKAR